MIVDAQKGVIDTLNRKRMRQLRRFNDLTLAELAEKVGYRSSNSIWKLENSETDAPISKLERMAAIFGVDVQELLLDETLAKEPIPPK